MTSSAQRPVGSVHIVTTPPPYAPVPPQRRRGPVMDLSAVVEPEGRRRLAEAVLFWLLALVAGFAVVAYLVGSVFTSHTQRVLTEQLRVGIGQAYGAVHDSLAGAQPVTVAPTVGAPVAVLQIPRTASQQVIAEGATGSVLRGGPGHVPGTAAVGQPGNAVVVGRRRAFGGAFSDLEALRIGDKLLTQTDQGKSVYAVTSVTHVSTGLATYAPTSVDQLTLMTSDRWYPWASDKAVVVTAQLQGKAFVPTPQNGYSAVADGRHGDSSAWPLLVLELLALAIAAAAAGVLYRRWTPQGTYLVTTPALLALVVFITLTGSRLLPGWF